jgi:hypothetical protein
VSAEVIQEMATGINSAGAADIPWSTAVENGFNESAIWLVPCLLVLLQFFLKLFIGERASWYETWKNFLQSPVDVGFLALSFACTLIISKPSSVGGVLATSIVFLLLLVMSIIIWKISPIHTTRKSVLTSSGLVILNFLITGMMLIFSVSLLMRGV